MISFKLNEKWMTQLQHYDSISTQNLPISSKSLWIHAWWTIYVFVGAFAPRTVVQTNEGLRKGSKVCSNPSRLAYNDFSIFWRKWLWYNRLWLVLVLEFSINGFFSHLKMRAQTPLARRKRVAQLVYDATVTKLMEVASNPGSAYTFQVSEVYLGA